MEYADTIRFAGDIDAAMSPCSHDLFLFDSAPMKDGTHLAAHGRGADIFRKERGNWKIVHEHFCVPAPPR
jgi:hypothetical protein